MNPWDTQPSQPRTNRLGLVKRKKVRLEKAPHDDGHKQDEVAMRAIWPDYQWLQKEEDFPLRRSEEYKGETSPLETDTMKAIKWYWNRVTWRADDDLPPDEVGVSWRELSIDCWEATGVIPRFPKSKERGTTLQHMAEAFAKASRSLEEEETKGGGWLWRGRCDRTSALAPFGQKAAVTGLKRRPRLVCAETVGLVLCRLAAAKAEGESEQKVEEWRHRAPPVWRRWGVEL